MTSTIFISGLGWALCVLYLSNRSPRLFWVVVFGPIVLVWIMLLLGIIQ